MKRRKKSRVKASLACLFSIMILGVGLTVIYKNVNSKEDKPDMDSAVPEEELESFYNSGSENDNSVMDRSIDELELLLEGRRVTGSVIPYDGQERNIVCYGDSMTEGVGASHAIIKVDGEKLDISYWTYPDALQYLTGIDTYNYGAMIRGQANSNEYSVTGSRPSKKFRPKKTSKAKTRSLRKNNTQNK